MAPARFVVRDPSTTAFCPTSITSNDSTAKDLANSPACSPTMPGAGTKRCRDILKESVSSVASGSSAVASSATAASFSSSTAVGTGTTRTSTTDIPQTQETQGPPTCIRRSSSSSSGRVSFGTIEIHVVEPLQVPDTTTGPAVTSESETVQTSTLSTPSGDAEKEETSFSSSSSSSFAAVEETPCLLSPLNSHVDPTSTQTCQEEPIKCGLETYERLRPPRRSRTELLLDAVRERSRRKLTHHPLSEVVIEAQKGLADNKNGSQASATAAIVDGGGGGGGHIDNNHCTLRRSDAVMTRSSNLSLEATKNRRSKRLDRLQGAAEGEIEMSDTGGLRSWCSNYGGGARL